MKILITLTSRNGVLPFGQKLVLRKEPENEYDAEAIAVLVAGKRVSYVAQFYKIRGRTHWSASRLLDHIPGQEIEAVVVGENVAEVVLPALKNDTYAEQA